MLKNKFDALERTLDDAQGKDRVLTTAEERIFDETFAAVTGIRPQTITKGNTMKTLPKLTRIHSAKKESRTDFKNWMALAVNDSSAADTGEVAEILQEYNHVHGTGLEAAMPTKFLWGYSKDLGATPGNGSAESWLNEDRLSTIDTGLALVENPSLARLGIRQVHTSERTLEQPKQGEQAQAEWILPDAPLTGSDAPLFTMDTLTPKTLGCNVKLLRSSMYSPEAQVRTLNSIRSGLERAVFSAMFGETQTNAPANILTQASPSTDFGGTVVINSTTGQKLKTLFLEWARYVRVEVPGPHNCSYIFHPNFASYLDIVPKSATVDSPLNDMGQSIFGVPFHTIWDLAVNQTTGMKFSLVGDLSTITFATFGELMPLQLNPYAQDDWAAGHVQARVLLDCSFHCSDPKQLIKFETIAIPPTVAP